MSDQQPVDVCAAEEIEDGGMRTVPARETGWSDAITIFRDGDAYYALDDTCPHEKASLGEGWLENGEIECPVHQSRFSVATGAVACPPALRNARAHRVEVLGGRVVLSPGRLPGDVG
ncbi:2Fe-2S ferredoxin [Mangrovactinospora gilvigrisea]|uniref:2Fe-2S ferredoxin n=1 Tax=Mangrovactinospora gilvigrisea TaxID=1428644 RepID=A0A1J7BFL5_9ACTN|nr:non-heme iron oxygenase ferredoxin subunit [Mangrovactinospora gilvigrisea]OIV37479.1 2Fe-2S ferredoxin [Mangrovactinospora gilvigrisea]